MVNAQSFVVYVDDAQHALLELRRHRNVTQSTHWIVVACAPKLTHRINKWVSHTGRESWRRNWADKLFGQLVHALRGPNDRISWHLAKGPIAEMQDELHERYGQVSVIDARRPKFSDSGPASTLSSVFGGSFAGFGALLSLAWE
jgi:hypothetical protein